MELKEFVASLPLGNIKSIERYKKGQRNDTYKLVSDKGDFSLRIYNFKKPGEIQFELAVLDCLKNLPVPHLVLLPAGFIKKFNSKYAVIYSYLPGEELDVFTPRQLYEIGAFIGEFHARCKYFVWKKKRDKFYNLPDWKIEKYARLSQEAGLPHIELLPEIIGEIKKNRLDKKLPQGPIHVDIKPENVLFHDGRLSGVLDFDNSFVGPFILDLAKSMVWFGIQNKKLHLNTVIPLYEGYISKRPLNALEQAELYKAIKFAFLSHVFVDYYMRSIEGITQEYFEFMINDLYAAYKSFDVTKEEFDCLLS